MVTEGGKEVTSMTRLLGKDPHLVSFGAMSKQPLYLPTSQMIFKNLKCHGRFLSFFQLIRYVTVLSGFWQSRWYADHSLHERARLARTLTVLISNGKVCTNSQRSFGLF